MPVVIIHQTIHGYRDGHRLLRSSTPLSADATRAILVLSDMSGMGYHNLLAAIREGERQ